MKGIRLCCDDDGKIEKVLIQELNRLYAISPNKYSTYAKVIKKEPKKRKGVKKNE